MATKHTPESMTALMCKNLGFNLEQYSNYSNAYLATLEEIAQEAGQPRMLYIYQGGAHPQAVIDVGQRWQKKVKRHNRLVLQEGRVYTNKKGEVCLKWTTIED